MKSFLKNLITPPIGVIALTYILSGVVWVGFFFIYHVPNQLSGTVSILFKDLYFTNHIVSHILSYAAVVLTSVLLTQMINKYSFIRTRTFLPTLIYLTLISVWLPIHGDFTAFFASVLVLSAVHIALGLYKMRQAVEPVFLLSLFIGVAALIVPEYLMLIFFFWIGFSFLSFFSGRIFLVSLFGLLTPFILSGSIVYYFLPHNIFPILLEKFVHPLHFFQFVSVYQLIYLIVLFLILLISLLQMFKNSNKENIQTRNELNFLKLIGLGVLFLFLFVNTHYISFLPLIAGFYALLISYSLTLHPGKFNAIIFSIFIVSNVLLLGFFLFI